MNVWIVCYVDQETYDVYEICKTKEIAEEYCEVRKNGRENWSEQEGWFVKEEEVLEN